MTIEVAQFKVLFVLDDEDDGGKTDADVADIVLERLMNGDPDDESEDDDVEFILDRVDMMLVDDAGEPMDLTPEWAERITSNPLILIGPSDELVDSTDFVECDEIEGALVLGYITLAWDTEKEEVVFSDASSALGMGKMVFKAWQASQSGESPFGNAGS